ncbi:hypothetical protein SDC9_125265 [bioreactor metagenome]|uniref:Uncharacterized protein n=1 Tax=bioreactor metagenome TaxID=1076179 RepID=A0A645CN01_9ZZZZ
MPPMAAMVATAEPDTAPKKALARKVHTARLPGSQPTRALARPTRRLAMPPLSNRPPQIMKKGTARKEKELMEANIFTGITLRGILEKSAMGTREPPRKAVIRGTPRNIAPKTKTIQVIITSINQVLLLHSVLRSVHGEVVSAFRKQLLLGEVVIPAHHNSPDS